MRELREDELTAVSGAGKKSSCYSSPQKHHKKHSSKGNNGFGNGGRDGVPGNSGHSDKKR